MRKGITPIISVVILLLLAVAIAGAGYTWISGYYGGLTSKAIQITDVTCTTGEYDPAASPTPETALADGGEIVIRFTNIGTDALIPASDLVITRETIGAGTPTSVFDKDELVFTPSTVNPSTQGKITDPLAGDIEKGSATKDDTGLTFKYFIEVGGIVVTTQKTC